MGFMPKTDMEHSNCSDHFNSYEKIFFSHAFIYKMIFYSKYQKLDN